MMTGSMMSLMSNVIVQLPLFLLWLGGIAWALRTWRNHPRVSLLVTIGLALQLVDSLAASVTYALMPMLIEKYGYSMQSYSWISMFVTGGRALTSTAAWAVILVAMFGWRPIPAAS